MIHFQSWEKGLTTDIFKASTCPKAYMSTTTVVTLEWYIAIDQAWHAIAFHLTTHGMCQMNIHQPIDLVMDIMDGVDSMDRGGIYLQIIKALPISQTWQAKTIMG